ncbi:TrmH family RNA methyltransferase [Flagellimonas beolgyonensis]|uniref:TrmH family RNA methyltransferase n=1 Tax=Flagellimonas beolgyonensis TaxID=864064 RepID=UPI003D657EA6
MVTKNQIKLVVNLKQKKYRSQHGLFVVEGEKVVRELLAAKLKVHGLYVDSTEKSEIFPDAEVVGASQLKQMSSLKQPNGVLGVFRMPTAEMKTESDWVLVLDAVRDPGNLGTIVRLCDWFNIKQLVCSLDTVDCYNPKVLQATMGSIARVQILYTDLKTYLLDTERPIFGAFMDGASVYTEMLPKKGILVMGNEANGISEAVEGFITKRIAIPQFGNQSTESLNVATATAILLSEIRR